MSLKFLSFFFASPVLQSSEFSNECAYLLSHLLLLLLYGSYHFENFMVRINLQTGHAGKLDDS